MISTQNVSLRYGDRALFENVSVKFTEGNCYGIIGANGAGKSTFLKILAGEIEPNKGEVIIEPHKRLSVLKQDHFAYDENKVVETVIMGNKRLYEIMQEKERLYAKEDFNDEDGILLGELEGEFADMDGWNAEADAETMLNGLGITSEFHDMYMKDLDGNQKVKVLLAQALFGDPDILLLDEPTNHLDVDSIKWLENYLSHYKGAVIIVSHDRYFLDKIVNKVMEIDQGHSMLFDGNYTTFIEKRDQIKAIRLKEYKHQQQEIKHQQEVIKKLKQFNREKSIKRAESREKALNKIDVLEKPTEYNADMRLSIEPEIISGNDVLTLKDVSKSFGNKSLFHGLSADIFREERVALIGPNGTGKTTLLKIICKKISNNGGTISLGAGVSIGYYDQAQDNLDDSKTIFDEISDAYPDLNNTKIRNTLAAFLFYGEDVFRPISSLSGGEKGRVSLAKLMLSHANFLILDEPTNHLDIQSKEILESAMNAYTGTILYVSHDRYFINKTATRILEISDHGLTSYPGNYQDYIAQKEKEKASLTSSTASSVSVDTESKLDWKQQKEEQAKQRKKENRLKKVEEQITELETKQEELSEAMSLPENASDPAKLMELSNEQASIDSSLEELYEEWETLC